MSCAECTRLGRPCVTSSIDCLDKVIDDLSSKISADEAKVQELLDQVESVRRRIARNKVIRSQNNERLDNQVRHAVEANSSSEEVNAGLSEVIEISRSLDSIDTEDPFDWRWDVNPTLASAS